MPLTQKELTAIEDALTHESQLVKKFRNYASIAQDPAIKTQAEQIADRHKHHYDMLMGHLYQC